MLRRHLRMSSRVRDPVNNSETVTVQFENFIAICLFVRQRNPKKAVLYGKMQASKCEEVVSK